MVISTHLPPPVITGSARITFLLSRADVPLEHFVRYGAEEGRVGGLNTGLAPHTEENIAPRSPAALISCRGQGGQGAEVIEADYKLLRDSGLFDLDWYRARAKIDSDIDAIEHYLLQGWLT